MLVESHVVTPDTETRDDGTVVVTGVAGSVGQRLLARLDDDPNVQRVIGIDPRQPPVWSAKLEHHSVDLSRADLLPLLRGAGCIVHLAHAFDEDRAAPTQANLVGTRRLLDAAEVAEVRHLVALSSATVYGAWPNNPVPLTEDAPLRPVPEFAYAVGKADVEHLLADWCERHHGTTVAVLRPTVALGEEESSWIARALVAAAGLHAGDSDPPVQFLHLDDLAAAVDVARRSRLDGPYNVAPDGWIPGETARQLSGSGPAPRLPERVAARVAEWSWELRLGPIPPGLLPYTVHPWVIANDRLRRAGWVPRYTNEEAFVAGHEGSRWSMMSPKRRQELALGASGAAILLGAVGVGWLARRARRRGRP